jgi:DNA polymerase-3 subunit delta
MTPEQAIQQARLGEIQPVYLVLGEEQRRRGDVVRALREAALKGSVPGLNEDQLTAGECTVDSVLSAARTVPMMGPRRFVLARTVERWETPAAPKKSGRTDRSPLDDLANYASSPTPTTTLVLVASKLDGRRRLVSSAKSGGWLVACDPLSRRALPAWIENAAREHGNRLVPGVADLLSELSGPELSSIADALDRVCLFVGDGAEVTEDDVALCITRVRTATVWELVAAVGRRDIGAALSSLHDVYDPQDRGLRLLGVLAWSTRQLLRFESATRAGLKPPEAAQRAGAPPFKARELSEQIRHIARPELERWLETLARVDLQLKGGSRRPPKSVLEHAIIELCAGGRGSTASRRTENWPRSQHAPATKT